MTNIAFIPVRGGSKSIPLKNIKILNGKPLVYWTAKAANDARCIDLVVIATDSPEIKRVVEELNLEKVVVYNRDKENAQDTSSTESVMLEYINKSNLNESDYFFLIQATSPLLKSQHIEDMFKQMIDASADSSLSCVKNKRFYWNEYGQPLNYNWRDRPRRQDFSGCFMENGACYINTVGGVKKDRNRLSGKIAVYEMPEYTAIEIDEPDDFIILEKLMKKYTDKNSVKIKLFATDVDGTMTDTGMYYTENGDEIKKFSTLDGMGFQLLREAGIKTAIITSETTSIVKRRAEKIKADVLKMGCKNKKEYVTNLCKEYNISLDEVAYIGDDINDYDLLSCVGIAACPANAVAEIKNCSGIISLSREGGHGAIREFVEVILSK